MKLPTLRLIALVTALAAFLIVCTRMRTPTDAATTDEWKLVWQDEFDGQLGQSPDPTKWGYDIGTDWGNAQLEYDTDRPENVALDGQGNLAIVARKESYLGSSYTSARIVTRNLMEPTYGKIEARIRLPIGQGIWPAFWLLGANIEDVGWPACGEIDIMEYRGQYPASVHGSLHGPGYSGSSALTRQFTLSNGTFHTGYHVFTVEWSAGQINWFVDGQLYSSVKPQEVSGTWAFNHPFYVILNVAVGGNWVGAPDNSTLFPQTMLVDWVRVYQR